MKGTCHRFAQLCPGRASFPFLSGGAIPLTCFGVREKEIVHILRGRVSKFVVRQSRIGRRAGVVLLCFHIGFVQSTAFLCGPTECGVVDNAIQTILTATLTGFVGRLRLNGRLNTGVGERTSDPSRSTSETYQFRVLLASTSTGLLGHVCWKCQGSLREVVAVVGKRNDETREQWERFCTVSASNAWQAWRPYRGLEMDNDTLPTAIWLDRPVHSEWTFSHTHSCIASAA